MSVNISCLHVTHFNHRYLPQFLALHASFVTHHPTYELAAFCLDVTSFSLLCRLNLPNVKLTFLPYYLTPELKQAHANRTESEFIWTLTPYTLKLARDLYPDFSIYTYIDSDMYFYSSVVSLLKSFMLSGKDILFTDHNYDSHLQWEPFSGRFCVQYICVRASSGYDIVDLWYHQCVAWCYSRYAPDLFGDQKYLDYLFASFTNRIYTTKDSPLFQAPWNIQRFNPSSAIAFHFHGLRIHKHHIRISNSVIPDRALIHFYLPYLYKIRSYSGYLKHSLYHSLLSFLTLIILKLLPPIFPKRSIVGRFLSTRYPLTFADIKITSE